MTGAPNVEVWALPRVGAPVVLADLADYEISRVDGEVGTVSLQYPQGGAGWDLLYALREPYQRLPIEIRTDGTAATARRAILTDAQGDPTKPSAYWTITGLFEGLVMQHARCPYSEDGPDGNTVIDGTPGVIIRTLMVQAQARGALLDVDFSSITNTTDSNGAPWAKTATLTFSPGRDYLSILQEMQTKLGMCEWEMVGSRTLRVYNPGGRGTDRTIPGQQVTLEYGRDFFDGPVTSSNRDVGTDVLGVGVNGMYVEATNAAARSLLGERIEVYADFGSVYDDATLTALTEATAEQAGVGAHSYSHELVIGPDSPIPGVDYDVSDLILRAVGGRVDPVRVSQIALRRSAGKRSVTVTLGDLLADREVTTRQMVEGLANGSAIVGTSVATPETDDGKAPAAPTGLAGSSIAYYDGGTAMSAVTVSWNPVLTNEDTTALDDLSGYEVYWKYAAGQDLVEDWQIAGMTTGTVLTWSPIAAAKGIRVKVRAVDKWQHAGPDSAEYPLLTATDADPPPIPSTPQVTSYLGVLTVQWDGNGSAAEPMPADTEGIEIHLSVSGPTFTPDRPLTVDGKFDPSLSDTFAGFLTVGGVFPIPVGDYGTTYYAKLVAVDKTGNASAASTAGSAVLTQVGDGDVAAMSVGKLTTGILTALMTVSGLIRTAITGGRVEISNGGLILYRPSGTKAMHLDATTGDVYLYKPDGTTSTLHMTASTGMVDMLGKLTAGAAAATGARIIVDPTVVPNPTIYFHTATSNAARPAFMNGFVDGSGSADVGIGINSGGTSAGKGVRVALFNARGVMELIRTSDSQRRGGAVQVDETYASLTSNNESGTEVSKLTVGDNGQIEITNVSAAASIVIESDGDVRLNGTSGKEVTANRPMGTSGAGFSMMAQGGAAGGYRTYTGGGSYLAFVDNNASALVNLGGPDGAYKTFVIDHPDDPSRWLIHACTEAPVASVEYRGTATIVDHQAVVELPSYFESATTGERHVQVTLGASFERVERPAISPGDPYLGPEGPGAPLPLPEPGRPATPEHALLSRVAVSPIVDGRFRIVSDADDGTLVHWHVQATRADAPAFDPEPLRSDVDVSGFGPYRTFTPREKAA